MRRTVFILASSFLTFVCLLPLSTFAVEYTAPDGTGWWQLQESDTYSTVCTMDSGVCDVPPGVYTLVNFRTNPATRTRVTINEPSPPISGALTISIERFVGNAAPSTSFESTCPVAGALAASATCTAADWFTGEALPLRGLAPNHNSNSWICRAPRQATFKMYVTCIGP